MSNADTFPGDDPGKPPEDTGEAEIDECLIGFVVIVAKCADAEQIVAITKDVMVFGRHLTCDVCFDSSSIARRHCSLTREGLAFFVEDLRNSGETIVNGKRISSRTRLGLYETVRFRNAEFRLEVRPAQRFDVDETP